MNQDNSLVKLDTVEVEAAYIGEGGAEKVESQVKGRGASRFNGSHFRVNMIKRRGNASECVLAYKNARARDTESKPLNTEVKHE